MLTALHAFARRTAGASLRGTEAAGGFDALRRTAAAAERRVRVVRRAVGDSRVGFRLIRVFFAVRAVVGTIAKGHRPNLTGSS